MFKKTDRVDTPKGPGTIKTLKKSTYSQSILFYIVQLDSGKDYFCPIDLATEFKSFDEVSL